MSTFASSDPTETANNILAWVDNHKGQFGGDTKVTFAAATELIRDGLQDGSIDPNAFLNALDANITRRDGSVMSLAKFRDKDLGSLVEIAEDARSKKLKRDIDMFGDEDRLAYINARNEWNASDRTEEDLARIKAKYRFNDPSIKLLLALGFPTKTMTTH